MCDSLSPKRSSRFPGLADDSDRAGRVRRGRRLTRFPSNPEATTGSVTAPNRSACSWMQKLGKPALTARRMSRRPRFGVSGRRPSRQPRLLSRACVVRIRQPATVALRVSSVAACGGRPIRSSGPKRSSAAAPLPGPVLRQPTPRLTLWRLTAAARPKSGRSRPELESRVRRRGRLGC